MAGQRQRSKRNNASPKQTIECFKAALFANEIKKPTLRELKNK